MHALYRGIRSYLCVKIIYFNIIIHTYIQCNDIKMIIFITVNICKNYAVIQINSNFCTD